MLKYIFALPDGTIETMEFETTYAAGTMIAYHHLNGITPIQVNYSDGRLLTDMPLYISKEFLRSQYGTPPANWRNLMESN